MTGGGLSEIALLLAAPFVGSFLGVLIQRLPTGASWARGRSHCPACGRSLAPVDLVPLLSWLAARARCRGCGSRIGAFYPLTELASLAVAVWCVLVFPTPLLWPSALLGWMLLAAAEIDRRHFWLPDGLVLPLIPAGLAVLGWREPTLLGPAAAGAVLGYTVMYAAAWLYLRARGREGLGLGDAKLFAAAGAWTTWSGLPSVLLIAAVTGLLAAGIAGLRGAPLTAGTALPFGPFLAAGLWWVWSFGPIALLP